MKLKISGIAKAHIDRARDYDEPSDEYDIATFAEIRRMDGISCDENFVGYMPEWDWVKSTPAHMKFRYDPKTEKLITEVVYEVDDDITAEQKDELADYTQGQWSDGIGEGFEQRVCGNTINGEEIYISPWTHGQIIRVEEIQSEHTNKV